MARAGSVALPLTNEWEKEGGGGGKGNHRTKGNKNRRRRRRRRVPLNLSCLGEAKKYVLSTWVFFSSKNVGNQREFVRPKTWRSRIIKPSLWKCAGGWQNMCAIAGLWDCTALECKSGEDLSRQLHFLRKNFFFVAKFAVAKATFFSCEIFGALLYVNPCYVATSQCSKFFSSNMEDLDQAT